MASSRIENAANIAVIVSALVFLGMAYRYLAPPVPAVPREAPIYSPGDSVGEIPGVSLSDGKQTVIFFLSSTCRYCTDSMPFYREVAQFVTGSTEVRERVQVVVVGREQEAVLRAYVEAHEFSPDQIKTVTEADTPKLALTPTLVLVNGAGGVDAAWIGQLDASNQGEFFARLVSERSQ